MLDAGLLAESGILQIPLQTGEIQISRSIDLQLLIDVGVALYGSRWQSELARDLGMSDRHIRRLVAGTAELTPGMVEDLLRIAIDRAENLYFVIKRLRDAADN